MEKAEISEGLAESSLAGSCELGVNDARTCEPRDTRLTQRRSLSDLGSHRPKRLASVYFIRSGDMIKIGYSRSPEDRMKALQTSHHTRLELIGVIPGSYQTESRLHRQFRHLKGSGEWFRATPDLLLYIRRATNQIERTPIVVIPPRAPTPGLKAMISDLTKERAKSSYPRRGYISNLIEQLHNRDQETDPTARAHLDRFIAASVAAIQTAA
jgi:hypothetical protein